MSTRSQNGKTAPSLYHKLRNCHVDSCPPQTMDKNAESKVDPLAIMRLKAPRRLLRTIRGRITKWAFPHLLKPGNRANRMKMRQVEMRKVWIPACHCTPPWPQVRCRHKIRSCKLHCKHGCSTHTPHTPHTHAHSVCARAYKRCTEHHKMIQAQFFQYSSCSDSKTV